MKLPQIAAAAVTAAVLGTAGVSIAGATSSSQPSTSTPTVAAAQVTAAKPGGRIRIRLRRRILRGALVVSAKTIGITPGALRKELRAGHTIATVAGNHSVTSQTVINSLVAAGTVKIEALKKAGTITAARAATLEQKLPGRATTFVNDWLPKHHA